MFSSPRSRQHPPARTRRSRLRAGVLGAALALGACSPSDEAASTTNRESAVAAATTIAPASADQRLALPVVQADPFERIGVEELGIDEGTTIELSTATQSLRLPLYPGSAGLYLVVPPHPDAPLDGGDVDLRINGADPTTLTIAPLPDAPGATAAFDAALRLQIGLRAAAEGATLEELTTTPLESIAPNLAPLKLLQVVLDALPIDELSPDELAVLDGVIMATDPLSSIVLVDTETLLDDLSTADDDIQPQGFALRSIVRQESNCVDSGVEIRTANGLSRAMRINREGTNVEGGPLDEVVSDLGIVTRLGGSLPGAWGVPFDVGGAALGLAGLMRTIDAGKYPGAIDDLTAVVTGAEFNEDFTEDGTWDEVKVVASATGFTADTDLINTFGPLVSSAIGQAADLGSWQGAVLSQVQSERDSRLGQFVEQFTSGVFNVCPKKWTVEITGEPWSTGVVLTGPFEADITDERFRPTAVGEGILRIRTNPAKFQSQRVSADVDLVARQIVVDVTPQRVTVNNPGDVVDITTTIENADTETLDWVPESGSWSDGTLNETNAPDTRPLTTPLDGSAFPFDVRVESTSTTGLRADSDFPRVASMTIELAQLIIEPNPASVRVGQTVQFTATNRDGDPVEVRWTATGGSISPNGLYTASDETGDFTVTAVATNGSGLRATVPIKITDGDCLIGTWDIRGSEFADALSELSGGEFNFVGGAYTIQVNEDGTYIGIRSALQIQIVTPEGFLLMTIDSVDPGTWSADETLLTINESGSEATVSLVASANGQSVEIGGSADPGGLSGAALYQCDSGVLSLSLNGASYRLDRL